MAIKYPEGLPLALRDGYGFSPVNNITRTEMQSGQARQRIEFQSVPDMLNLKWNLTEQQSALFGTWARNIVGAGWFYMKIVTPVGFDEVKMRFIERVDGPRLTARYAWEWSATVEIEQMPELDPGWVENPEYFINASIFDVTMNSTWPLNQWQRYIQVADEAINEDWPTP